MDSDSGAKVGAETGEVVLDPVPVAPLSVGPAIAIAERGAGSSLIARPRLTDRLLASESSQLVLLEAPAGYAKTTCLALWDEADRREFCWLSCQRRHDDPVLLVSAIVEALEPVHHLDPELFSALSGPLPDIEAALDRLEASIRRIERTFVIVIDDTHNLRLDDSYRVLESVLGALPTGCQMAIGSRNRPGLRLGRLRAKRRLLEFGPAELAMTRREAAELIARLGLDLETAHFERLYERTEGWPAALYLGGLALQRANGSASMVAATFSGDDETVVEYLRDEFFEGVPPERARFLYLTSVLEDLSAPVCDAVTGREDSTLVLEELARHNAMVVPLDRKGNHYRYHHLFADMLRSELRRSEPQAEVRAHAGAARWLAENGELEGAVGHAIEAGDTDLAGELIWRALPATVSNGRVATLSRWIDDLGPDRITSSTSPALALAMAHRSLALGDGSEGRYRASVVPRLVAPDSEYMADVHMLKATIGADGAKAMAEDAGLAARLHQPTSPWQSAGRLYTGIGLHLAGEPGRADEVLQDAVRSGAVFSPLIQALALNQRSLIAIGTGDLDHASQLISQARDQVERCGLDSYPIMAVVFAASAWVRALRGRTDAAREEIARAERLMERLDDYFDWIEAETRLPLSAASLRLGDIDRAEELLASAAGAIEGFADAPVLVEWRDNIAGAINDSKEELRVDGTGLTAAEVRVLQHLPSHLSFEAIGEELIVSKNTVKSQARSLYRKLGVSSRDEAVSSARRAGLLDGE